MSKIVWDETGKRIYETGVDHGVLFVKNEEGAYGNGVAWNGLINVNESPTGAEPNPLYADNIKYLNFMSVEEWAGSIEAYTYPEEFEVCDGMYSPIPGVKLLQQTRREFAFAYRTLVGNDVKLQNYGYKIHLVYGCLASPSEKAHATVNDTPEAMTFSWDITTTAVPCSVAPSGYLAAMEFDSTKLPAEKMALIEAKLFGSDEEESTLPMPDEILALLGVETVSDVEEALQENY